MMLRSSLFLCLVAVAACGSGSGDEQPQARTSATADATPAPVEASPAQKRGVRLARVGSFDSPVYVTSPPADRRRLFVVEQGGRIMVVRGGRKLARPFLDIRRLVEAGGEQGLLSVAFPPDYASSGRFYVYYTTRAGNQRIEEYRRASADRADAGSARRR